MSGGLPRGRVSLLVGGPGCGKTLLALQTLVNGARQFGEPGVFVAFEEDSRRLIENASKFGWNIPELQKRRLFFLDAQPTTELVNSGAFDLLGLLANLDAKCRSLRAKRIVFDSLDVLLDMLGDESAKRREALRLHEWLLRNGLTALITSKVVGGKADPDGQGSWGFMQFMVDCAIALNHELSQGVSQRSLQVIKYRGSSFSENASPFMIGPEGLEVAGSRRLKPLARVFSERVSSGVERLDSMLGGGYFRGASVLVTGSPGTSKTTLCGAFVAAACQRGERSLFVSFDSDPKELVRNLASISLPLRKHEKSGVLRVTAARSGEGSAEAHFLTIKRHVREFGARCLVIDPVSALAKQGNQLTAHSVVERLVDWGKSEGITMVFTSLLADAKPDREETAIQISTIADTWIHLSYLVHAGERNRSLTIIKSRGTSHSNQVRELILSHRGITLADVYTAGGAVLMGTLRWEKEGQMRAEQKKLNKEFARRAAILESEESHLSSEIKKMQSALKAKQRERREVQRIEKESEQSAQARQSEVQTLRGGDAGGI